MEYLFETERLRIRKFVMEDAGRLFEIHLEEEVKKWFPNESYADMEETRGAIQFYIDCVNNGHLPYVLAVELKETGELIGDTGVSEADGNSSEAEAGYVICKRHRGKGYAAELLKAMTDFMTGTFGITVLYGRVVHGNTASMRVLEKSGYEFVGEEFGAEDDPYGNGMLVYKRICPEWELAAFYVPRLRYDRAEPFSPEGIGYTVYRQSADSPSCSRRIEPPEGGVAIEYAFYYDFDIQHLYDLEHVFVYLDGQGHVTGVEGSFHGKFLNSMIEGVLEFDGLHPILYVQPGKHAFMPAPEYFKLVLDRDVSCGEKAGIGGFLVMPMFEGRLHTDEGLDRKIETFIREKYAFAPTWEFRQGSPDGRAEEELLMPYPKLDGVIVERLETFLKKTDNCFSDFPAGKT